MAVPDQETAAVGGLISASLWNDDVRDAVDFLINPPRVRLRYDTTHLVGTSSYEEHPWNVEVFDTDGIHTGSSSQMTIVTAGTYLLTGAIAFEGHATGQRRAAWYLNGSAIVGGLLAVPAGVATNMVVPAPTMMVSLTAGDDIELVAWQNSGSALNVNPGSGFTSFAEARWVAAA
jgi:hypothetical protein